MQLNEYQGISHHKTSKDSEVILKRRVLEDVLTRLCRSSPDDDIDTPPDNTNSTLDRTHAETLQRNQHDHELQIVRQCCDDFNNWVAVVAASAALLSFFGSFLYRRSHECPAVLAKIVGQYTPASTGVVNQTNSMLPP